MHIDLETLHAIDAGFSTRKYDETYWAEELRSARERAEGEALVRVGEAILYARRPVQRFLDVGTGPGYLLDALARQRPTYAAVFHGVELFPPKEHSRHPNYFAGGVAGLKGHFDAGVCIEVVEHLTPNMLRELARDLAKVSLPDTLWFFNTGMPDLVLNQDPDYLDPLHRGHIVSYGLSGLEKIFGPYGFRISPIPGKNYAWLAEYQPGKEAWTIEKRILEPVAQNRELLGASSLMFQAAFESARASIYLDQAAERTKWALATEWELEAARKLHSALQNEHHGMACWAHGLDNDLKRAQASYAALQQEHESVARWAHGLDGDLKRMQENHASLKQEYAHLLQRTSALQAAHEQLVTSRSWRMTRPLRILAHRLKTRTKYLG